MAAAPVISPSSFTPSFLRSLEDPTISTVFLCGCGGGFDFVHRFVVHSHSNIVITSVDLNLIAWFCILN